MSGATIQFLYIISSGRDDGIYKLGITQHPHQRLEQIQRDYDVPDAEIIELMDVPSREEVFAIENALHTRFSKKRATSMKGREWFRLSKADLEGLREMYQTESNAFAQCKAYFGLVESARKIEERALQAEAKRQRQITYNRRNGRTYDTTPKGVLKRYKELKNKLGSGHLGERFTFRNIDHPTVQLKKDVMGIMKKSIAEKLKASWLMVGTIGTVFGLTVGTAMNIDAPMGLAAFGGVFGAASGAINQASRRETEEQEALRLTVKSIEQHYPGALEQNLEAIRDNDTGSHYLVKDYTELNRVLREVSPRLPQVVLPETSQIKSGIESKNMFPVVATLLTTGAVLVIGGANSQPSDSLRSQLLNNTLTTHIHQVVDNG